MTEAEWLACDNPDLLMSLFNENPSSGSLPWRVADDFGVSLKIPNLPS